MTLPYQGVHKEGGAHTGCYRQNFVASSAPIVMLSAWTSTREVLEWPYTIGGGGVPPPPLKTKVTTVGNNEIYNTENLVRPLLLHKLLGPRPPPPPPPLLLP